MTRILKISFVFVLAAGLLSGCSLLQKGRDAEQAGKEKNEALDYQDSLAVTVSFIEAKKEALLGNDELAVEKYKKVLERSPQHDAALFEMSRMMAKTGRYDEAVSYAEKAAESNPGNIWYRKMLVDLYQRTGKLEESRHQLRWLVENDKDDLQYYQDWYNLERYLENYNAALDILQKIQEIIGETEELVLREVRLLQETGDYKKAAEKVNMLLKKDSTNPEYFRELIALYNQINEPQKALEAIKRFKETGNDEGWADLMLAEQHRANGNNEKSYEALKSAIGNENLSIDPKVQVLLSYYSISNSTDSLNNQAKILLEELVKAHPDDPVSWSLKGDFLMQDKKYEEALNAFEKVISLDSTRYPVWEQVIKLQLQLKKNENAIETAERAINLFPEQGVTYLLKGMGHYQQKEYANVVETLEMGLYFVADVDMKVDFYSYLGDSYYNIQKYQDAYHAYERALQIDPDNAYVLNNYAYYLSLRGEQLEKAARMSKKVVDKYPSNATYLDTYGWVLFKQEKYREAKKALQKAVENSNEKSAEILEHYGDVLFMTGKVKQAVEYWKKAADEKTNNSDELQKKIENENINP